MKVVFSLEKNNSSKLQNFQVNFGAGLTPKMMQEIQQADVLEISKKLFQQKYLRLKINGNKALRQLAA